MSAPPTGPVAAGVRVPYDDLPAVVHAWVESVLGSAVVAAVTQPGGFSPGVAARLRCADGSRAFVKAVSAETNPESPDLHRDEAAALAVLPPHLPVPRLIASYDEQPWVALLIDDVEGAHPRLPWQDAELDLLLGSLREIAAVSDVALPPLADKIDAWRGWRQLAGTSPAPALDPWALGHLEELAELEAGIVEALPPTCLQHSDSRADNTLLAGSRAWVVDWPWAGLGPAWFDVVGMAPSVQMQGGPPPEELLRRSGTVVGGEAQADAVTTFVCAFAGYLVERSLAPAPPGLPTLRAFQAAQASIALDWLRHRTRWP